MPFGEGFFNNAKSKRMSKKIETPVKSDWFYADDNEKEMGIETIEYENGGKSKRVTLSDGRVAISRRLKGKDREQIKRLAGGDGAGKMQDAVIALSTKINDKDMVMEDLDTLWYDDVTKVQTIALSINFM